MSMNYDIVIESFFIEEALEGFDPKSLWSRLISALRALLRKVVEFFSRIKRFLFKHIPFLKKKLRREESERNHSNRDPAQNSETTEDDSSMEKARYLEDYISYKERYLSGVVDLLQHTGFFITELGYCASAIHRNIGTIAEGSSSYAYNDIMSTAELVRESHGLIMNKHSSIRAILATYKKMYPEGDSLVTAEACEMIQSTIDDLGKQMQNNLSSAIHQIEVHSKSSTSSPDVIQMMTKITATLQEFSKDSIQLSSLLIELI